MQDFTLGGRSIFPLDQGLCLITGSDSEAVTYSQRVKIHTFVDDLQISIGVMYPTLADRKRLLLTQADHTTQFKLPVSTHVDAGRVLLNIFLRLAPAPKSTNGQIAP